MSRTIELLRSVQSDDLNDRTIPGSMRPELDALARRGFVERTPTDHWRLLVEGWEYLQDPDGYWDNRVTIDREKVREIYWMNDDWDDE